MLMILINFCPSNALLGFSRALWSYVGLSGALLGSLWLSGALWDMPLLLYVLYAYIYIYKYIYIYICEGNLSVVVSPMSLLLRKAIESVLIRIHP